MDNKVGNFIKELRTEKNWSQEELAAKLYISRQSISKWELGQTLPSMNIMIKLAEIFELTLPEILKGERATKDNIKEINSNTTKEIIKIHKKSKKISIISTIIILLLLFIFLGYYFLTSYKSQNIYEVAGASDHFEVKDGLFIITRSNIYFTIQNIESSDELEEITLYFLDGGTRHDIYTKEKENNIFLSDSNNYNEYFNMDNKELYLKNMYLEVKSKKYTEDIKLNLRKIYENSEILKSRKNEVIDSNTNNAEIDNEKLINDIKSKFKLNNEIYELMIDNKDEQIDLKYYERTNIFEISKYGKNDISWKYDLRNETIIYEKIDNITYEIIEQDSASITEYKDFVEEFITIVNKYVCK